MSKKWRLQRTIVTVLMGLISALLLVGAWASLGRFHAEVAVDIAFIGLVLTPGFYGLFTLVGWQRSAGNGATPGRFVGWCLRNNVAAIAPVMFLFLLLGLGNNVNKAMDRPYARGAASDGAAGDFSLVDFRRGCVSSAVKALQSRGGDLAAARARIDSSCSCVAESFQNEFSGTEKAAWAANADRMQDPKFRGVVEVCLAKQ